MAWSVEAQAVIDRLGNLNPAEENAVGTFIESQEASGNWANIDEIQCYCLNATDHLKGWKGVQNATVTSGTHQDNGLHFAAASEGYINTGIDVSSLATYDVSDNCAGVFIASYPYRGSSGMYMFGAESATSSQDFRVITPNSNNVTLTTRINSSGDVANSVTQAQCENAVIGTRTAGGTTHATLNGVDLTDATGTASALNNLAHYIARVNNQGAPFGTVYECVIGLAYWGGALVDYGDFYSKLRDMLDAVVVPYVPPVSTFTSFGPIVCNDDTATLTWQCIRDAGPEVDWVDAETTLSNATVTTEAPDTTDRETTLTINTGQIADTGQISCLATSDYDAVGVRTKIDRLSVVEPS